MYFQRRAFGVDSEHIISRMTVVMLAVSTCYLTLNLPYSIHVQTAHWDTQYVYLAKRFYKCIKNDLDPN